MAEPKRKDWQKLKRVGRYLIMKPRVVIHFEWQSPLDRATGSTRKGGPEESTGYSDADWAGCSRTRRSASGGVVTLGMEANASHSDTVPHDKGMESHASHSGIVFRRIRVVRHGEDLRRITRHLVYAS